MERFGVLGISYHRGEAEEIARFSRDSSQGDWLLALRQQLQVEELIYLPTCNRVEFYYRSTLPRPADEVLQTLVQFFLPDSLQRQKDSAAAFFALSGDAAVKHLFQVVCGLDSLVFGDAQIAGQFRRSLVEGRRLGLCGPWLGLLGDEALKVSRKIRSTIDFGCRPTSVAEVAAEAMRHHCQGMDQLQVVLVGAGEMIRKTAARLHGWKRCRLHFVNRSLAGAQNLAAQFSASAQTLAEFQEQPEDFDVLIAATGAEDPILRAEMLLPMPVKPRKRLLLDLGMPADIDPEIQKLAGFERIGVLELGRRAEGARREAELLRRQARPQLRQALETFRHRMRSREMGPVAAAIRQQMSDRASREMDRWLSGPLAHLSAEDQKRIRAYTERLTAQTVQIPLSDLKRMAHACHCGRVSQAVQPNSTSPQKRGLVTS
ncbi:MAG: glutamyl-tRNA reductase [Planctomycetota bacterium]|nr:MAG: glutamyl-tRNA reductase [Planctomycetota bacterium]